MRFQLETLRIEAEYSLSRSVLCQLKEGNNIIFFGEKSALPAARTILICSDNCVKNVA